MNAIARRTMVALAALWCAVTLVAETGCERNAKNNVQVEGVRPMKNIDEVIRVYSDSLMAIPGVVGLYHGVDDSGRACLKVMVKKKTPELEERIPRQIEGYSVLIDETGEIKPMQ